MIQMKPISALAIIFSLCVSTASFAQDNDVIYLDESTFSETFGNIDIADEVEVSSKFQGIINNISSLPQGGEAPNSDIPVDGGLSFLLAAGLGYGANRLRKQRNQRKEDLS